MPPCLFHFCVTTLTRPSLESWGCVYWRHNHPGGRDWISGRSQEDGGKGKPGNAWMLLGGGPQIICQSCRCGVYSMSCRLQRGQYQQGPYGRSVYGTVSEQLPWEVLVGRSHILGPLTIGEPGGAQMTFSTQVCGVESPLGRSPRAFLVLHGAIILRLVQP